MLDTLISFALKEKMTKFADIGKGPSDLLSDDYTSKVTLKCKKAAGPLAVTIETERGSGGSLASKIGTKFSYAGLSFDKLQFKPDGSQVLETSMKPHPGLSVAFKGGKGADLHVDYSTGMFVTNTVIDIKDMSKVSTAATAAVSPGIVIGGDVAYALSGKTGVTGFNVGASYAKGPLFASLTSSSKVSSFDLGLLYKVNSTVSIASSTTHSSAKPIDAITIGGIYKASVGDVKAKFASDGVVSACLIKTVAPKVTLTCSGSAPISDLSNFKYGVGIVM